MNVIKIFVSYSHQNGDWVHEGGKYDLTPWLRKQLEQYNVTFWTDHALKDYVGEEYKKHIKESIDNADIAFLMISQDFATSEFIKTYELPWIKTRFDAGKIKIIPLLLTNLSKLSKRNIHWLFDLQTIPSEPHPLIEFVDNDKNWSNVRIDILDAIEAKIVAIREEQLALKKKQEKELQEKKRLENEKIQREKLEREKLEKQEKELLQKQERERLKREKMTKKDKKNSLKKIKNINLLSIFGIVVIFSLLLWLIFKKSPNNTIKQDENTMFIIKKDTLLYMQKVEKLLEKTAQSREVDFNEYKRRAYAALEMANFDSDYYEDVRIFCQKALLIKEDSALQELKKKAEIKLDKNAKK